MELYRVGPGRWCSPRWRWVGFRIAAIILGLFPLVVFEGALAVFDLGLPDPGDDPFVGFSAIRPLFALDRSGDRYEIAPPRRGMFRPDSFSSRKPSHGFRIFCLGGSTVQGRPFAIETSFTTWLRLSLEAADPSRSWEVVNCGGISYASYRLVPILREVLGYQPDLIILYTGQNEFLEDRTYHHIKSMPRFVAESHEWFSRFRSYNALRDGLTRVFGRRAKSLSRDRPVLPAEVEALLDYRGGLEHYHRDEAWRRGVIEHYEANLRRMVALCRAAGVPVLLVNPVCNLETPPFKSEHRADLTDEERAAFDRSWNEARALYATDLSLAMGRLRDAIELDDQHAGIQYILGVCYLQRRQWDAARETLIRAKDRDICPLRILEPMHAALFDVAGATGTPVVDAWELFAERSEGGIPGNGWLVDHVHPSIRGHQVLARALLEKMHGLGFLPLRPGWEVERDRRFDEQLASLGPSYFARGQQRLEALEGWARGRATDVPPAARPTQ